MRLFVGLDLPFATRRELSGLMVSLPGARWVPLENYHITLRFIGEVPGHVAEDIDQALAGLHGRAFPLLLSGVGTMEKSGRVIALQARVERAAALDHLRAKVETALQRAGLEPERRRFVPHVTVARLGDGADPHQVAAWIQARNLFRATPVQVGHFTLFSSLLGGEASVYTAEADYGLA